MVSIQVHTYGREDRVDLGSRLGKVLDNKREVLISRARAWSADKSQPRGLNEVSVE